MDFETLFVIFTVNGYVRFGKHSFLVTIGINANVTHVKKKSNFKEHYITTVVKLETPRLTIVEDPGACPELLGHVENQTMSIVEALMVILKLLELDENYVVSVV